MCFSLTTGVLCRSTKQFQKFKDCKIEMIFVADFMKNVHLKRVHAGNPVLTFPETNKLYNYINEHYKDCVAENQPASTKNTPSRLFTYLYAQTLDYRWQYVVMQAIDDFIRLGNRREQQEIQDKWIAYLHNAFIVYGEYVDKLPPTPVVTEKPTDIHEFWVFRPYENEMAFVANLMKNIYLKRVNVVNTDFKLFGLQETNLLYNMIIKSYANKVAEHPTAADEFYKHSLDYRWQWAVMSVINSNLASIKIKFRKDRFDKWIEYLRKSFTYANFTSNAFSAFIPYEKEVVFVAEFMKNMSPNYDTQKPNADDPVLKLEGTNHLYKIMLSEEYHNLLEERMIAPFTNRTTLVYAWQYVLMSTIYSLVRFVNKKYPVTTLDYWFDYLRKAYQLSQSAATPTAPVNAVPEPSAGGNAGPTPPGAGGGPPSGEQSDSAKSASDRPQSAPQSRSVKETESAEEARAKRLGGPVKETGNTRDEILKKLREIGETGGGAQDDAGQQPTASTPATSVGGGAGGKLVEKTPRPKPYDKITPEGGNEGPAAKVVVPKLPLPAEREVSPPASEVSDDDVKSDEEESDEGGGGPDVDTTPSTPAVPSTPNFEPENTPPPNPKSGNDRPQSAPQNRSTKEKRNPEELRQDRLRGAVTQRGETRDEKYKNLRKSGGVVDVSEAVQRREKEDALTQPDTPTTPTTPKTPRTSKKLTIEKVQEKALERKRETSLIAKSTSKIEEDQHENFSKKHHASMLELKKMYGERERQRKQETSKRKMDTQGDVKEDTEVEEKRPRTGQTQEEFTRVLMFTQEEERDMLYVQNENWRKYSAHITKLTQYIKKFTEEPGKIFTREEYDALLDDNPKTKLLIEYFKKYIEKDDVMDDVAMNVFHFTSIQDESIIVDAINFVISYDGNVDEWETFLQSTPEDLDTKDIKLAPGIGSKLHTFPADVSPLIYNLTRRLEALQDW